MPDTGLRGLPLLDAVIAHIEAHPETWFQAEYRCTSGMCVAGWAAELGGGTWAAEPHQVFGDSLTAEPGDDRDHLRPGPGGGDTILAADRAQRLFGFSRHLRDGRDLFGSYNTLADIKSMRDRIFAELAGRQP